MESVTSTDIEIYIKNIYNISKNGIFGNSTLSPSSPSSSSSSSSQWSTYSERLKRDGIQLLNSFDNFGFNIDVTTGSTISDRILGSDAIINHHDDPNNNNNNIETHELNISYTVLEILVSIIACFGNALVIAVFYRERRLRKRTNYYIVSLAIADFLVGLLGIPFAILASIGLPTNLYACLFTVSLLVVLCTISIFCLVAVSIDRYWAILYPLAYSRNVRTKTAIGIISFCWALGIIIGFLPLFGWHSATESNQACLFVKIMDYNYLVFLYFATIITPALLLFSFYVHIYTVIMKQVRKTVTINPSSSSSAAKDVVTISGSGTGTGTANPINSVNDKNKKSTNNKPKTNLMCISRSQGGGGQMLRVLGAARKREVKATQNLSIIVLFFMICWLPLYTVNCIQAFCPGCNINPKLMLFLIILSHLNSAVNPLLYAYHLKDFRAALKSLIYGLFGLKHQPTDYNYRFSIHSQHRIAKTLFDKRSSLQPKIYIDSPVYLRQQQLQQNKSSPALSSLASPIRDNHLSELSIVPAIIANGCKNIDDNKQSEIINTNNGGKWQIQEISSETCNSSCDFQVSSDPTDNTSIKTENRPYSFNYDHLDNIIIISQSNKNNNNKNSNSNCNTNDNDVGSILNKNLEPKSLPISIVGQSSNNNNNNNNNNHKIVHKNNNIIKRTLSLSEIGKCYKVENFCTLLEYEQHHKLSNCKNSQTVFDDELNDDEKNDGCSGVVNKMCGTIVDGGGGGGGGGGDDADDDGDNVGCNNGCSNGDDGNDNKISKLLFSKKSSSSSLRHCGVITINNNSVENRLKRSLSYPNLICSQH